MNLWEGKYQRSYIKWCRQAETDMRRQQDSDRFESLSVTDKTLLVDEAEQPALSFKYIFDQSGNY
ncbi:hypothetical protein OUZ56_006753 [Daphnia magna]|uniref:Uncharacterized protein n=1 Tax=Daphnia magna TaxID=35525 RepID=A0ABQ9YX16_9CRUS|nr:hypothetical protein OUZ56_006753 [Daphnia magna]